MTRNDNRQQPKNTIGQIQEQLNHQLETAESLQGENGIDRLMDQPVGSTSLDEVIPASGEPADVEERGLTEFEE
ncbi:hypothetical protein N6H14_25295 [Paenibacillus sp. CC-CFT747]|nr:hypothetical protein N6H14_25295 [Paenibacillus sp. CC-CFT747]